jgi:hypothetical protein
LFPGPEQRPTRPVWFGPAMKAVLDGAETLTSASGPRELERMTAGLLGAELDRVLRENHAGLRFGQWFSELVDAARTRVREGTGVAAFLLLHGLAAIGTEELARHASDRSRAVRKSLASDGALPEWLDDLTDAALTGEVMRMRDVYGTRFGVLAEYRYGRDIDPFVYLFDVDTSGFIRLAGAGDFDDVEQAAAAWRAAVGDAAVDARPQPVTDPEELLCLSECDIRDEMIMGDEERVVLDNWFRAQRRIDDLSELFDGRGTPLPVVESLYHDIDLTPMIAEFSSWYEDGRGVPPDPEAVEALAGEWAEGRLPETRFRISPQRLEFMLALIGDWVADDPVTIEVRALLPDWARWLGERNGLPEPFLERVVTAARAS